MEHCIIRADFADFRRVKGRKVLQLFMEIPLEEAPEALRVLGHPVVGESKWCAIALLENGKSAGERSGGLQKQPRLPSETSAQGGDQTGSEPSPIVASIAETGTSETQAPEGGGSPKKWSQLARSQQAYLLTRDPEFLDYFGSPNHINCDGKLKLHFRIASKAELDLEKNHARWDEFVALYQLHRDRLK